MNKICLSGLLSILVLLFGCQSRAPEPDMYHEVALSTRLSVIQVGDLSSVEALHRAGVAQWRARMRADEVSEDEIQMLRQDWEGDFGSYIEPYRQAARDGYSSVRSGDECYAYVRVGSDYERNLGRAAAACL